MLRRVRLGLWAQLAFTHVPGMGRERGTLAHTQPATAAAWDPLGPAPRSAAAASSGLLPPALAFLPAAGVGAGARGPKERARPVEGIGAAGSPARPGPGCRSSERSGPRLPEPSPAACPPARRATLPPAASPRLSPPAPRSLPPPPHLAAPFLPRRRARSRHRRPGRPELGRIACRTRGGGDARGALLPPRPELPAARWRPQYTRCKAPLWLPSQAGLGAVYLFIYSFFFPPCPLCPAGAHRFSL